MRRWGALTRVPWGLSDRSRRRYICRVRALNANGWGKVGPRSDDCETLKAPTTRHAAAVRSSPRRSNTPRSTQRKNSSEGAAQSPRMGHAPSPAGNARDARSGSSASADAALASGAGASTGAGAGPSQLPPSLAAPAMAASGTTPLTAPPKALPAALPALSILVSERTRVLATVGRVVGVPDCAWSRRRRSGLCSSCLALPCLALHCIALHCLALPRLA